MFWRGLPSLLWDLTGSQALAEPLCALSHQGTSRGALLNLWALIPQETSGMGSASGSPKAWRVISRIIGGCSVLIRQLVNQHGREVLPCTLQSQTRLWKQHNSPVITESKTFPEVQQPPWVNSLLCPVLHWQKEVNCWLNPCQFWALCEQKEQLLLGSQSDVCLHSPLWISENINL